MRPTRRWVWVGSGLALLAAFLLWRGQTERGERSPAGRLEAAAPADPLPPRAAQREVPARQPAASKPAPAPPKPASGPAAETVFTARWGGAPGELGRRAANESSPEGPMSFDVDSKGRAFVLDQVNGRVQVFEPGAAPRSIPVPVDTYQDVALGEGDRLALLDRFTNESVAFVDTATGRLTHEVALPGEGIAEGGDVTGLFQRKDGTWAEVKHANLVRIADAAGNPLDDRDIVQGRFGEGGVLRASKSGERGLAIAIKRDGRAAEPLAKLGFDTTLWQILALETDARGRIFVGASLHDEGGPPAFEVTRASEVVVVLEPNGAELRRVELPASTGPEESFRRIRVGADGLVYHMAYEEKGVTLRKVRL